MPDVGGVRVGRRLGRMTRTWQRLPGCGCGGRNAPGVECGSYSPRKLEGAGWRRGARLRAVQGAAQTGRRDLGLTAVFARLRAAIIRHPCHRAVVLPGVRVDAGQRADGDGRNEDESYNALPHRWSETILSGKDACQASFLLERHAHAGGPQGRLVYTAPRAAVGELAVDCHGRDAAHA